IGGGGGGGGVALPPPQPTNAPKMTKVTRKVARTRRLRCHAAAPSKKTQTASTPALAPSSGCPFAKRQSCKDRELALEEGAVESTVMSAVTAPVPAMFSAFEGKLHVGRCMAPDGEEVSAQER